ncbi:hypothetical protein [Bradyrhizobium sp. ERR14]|uniref:hypothetical protein n=1 Tax=Bradyrhizobium sp. ERR14 TaxID=2663837 RepID=UPI00161E9A0B|nr:hypothetical protein [Bradyrhizobium sp. ERR14]MBB4395069.1 hypothetical protein [Bradyrhizobium sp. ERR14]
MDITYANTEALLRFHRFHERLNRSIKVQVIGLRLLADKIEEQRPLQEIKDTLTSHNEFIGAMPDWTDPIGLVRSARFDIGRAGIVSAFSAFDLFLDEISAAVNRWRAFRELPSIADRTADKKSQDSGDADRLDKMYRWLGAKLHTVSSMWPVYRYFRLSRDCIVHRDGRASAALAEQSVASDVQAAIGQWVLKTGEQLPPDILRLSKGDTIDFTSRHAIAASSILRLAALDLNRQVIQELGRSGFVYLTAHEGFLAPEPLFDRQRGGTMLRALNWLLADRYRVRDVREVETARTLRALGLTKRCSKAFEELRAS